MVCSEVIGNQGTVQILLSIIQNKREGSDSFPPHYWRSHLNLCKVSPKAQLDCMSRRSAITILMGNFVKAFQTREQETEKNLGPLPLTHPYVQ